MGLICLIELQRLFTVGLLALALFACEYWQKPIREFGEVTSCPWAEKKNTCGSILAWGQGYQKVILFRIISLSLKKHVFQASILSAWPKPRESRWALYGWINWTEHVLCLNLVSSISPIKVSSRKSDYGISFQGNHPVMQEFYPDYFERSFMNL